MFKKLKLEETTTQHELVYQKLRNQKATNTREINKYTSKLQKTALTLFKTITTRPKTTHKSKKDVHFYSFFMIFRVYRPLFFIKFFSSRIQFFMVTFLKIKLFFSTLEFALKKIKRSVDSIRLKKT